MVRRRSRAAATILAAATMSITLIACSSEDSDDSAAAAGNDQAAGNTDASAAECGAGEPSSAGDALRFGGADQVWGDADLVKVRVEAPEPSTATAEYPGSGTLCSVAVEVTVVEGAITLNARDFQAVDVNGGELHAATVDTMFEDQELSTDDTYEGEVTFEVTDGAPIAAVEYEPLVGGLLTWTF